MEENTFMDLNPQFTQGYTQYETAKQSGSRDAIEAWFNPHIAEAGEFDRENFMMDKANAFNEYMYNKTNEYNSAAAQMERAKAAGINPNLMAAGIAGIGGNQATAPQSAQAGIGMNTAAINPIEAIGGIANTLGTLATAGNTAGEIFGFGAKNKAEINLIKTNAANTAETLNYTKAQRKQLEGIGKILIENAKLQGKELEKNLLVLDEQVKNLQKTWENIEADTELKKQQQGESAERTKTQEYENARLEYEKIFRNIFGIELTHSQMAMLVEGCLNGHGEEIVNYLIDTAGGILKGLKERLFEPAGEKTGNLIDNAKDNFANNKKTLDNHVKKAGLKAAKLEWYMLSKSQREQWNDDFIKWYRMKYGQKGYSGRW